jgi:hypothetical protein
VALFLAVILLLAQAAAPQTPATPKPATAPPADPASSHFTSDVGILLVTVKPAATADYELVIRTLQEALAKDRDPARSAAAKGWKVYKSNEPDAKGNPLYVHVLLPAVPNFDYRPSLLLDELVKELAPELLSKYGESFAAPPTRLNLVEFAHMAVAPVPTEEPKKPAEPKKPGQR